MKKKKKTKCLIVVVCAFCMVIACCIVFLATRSKVVYWAVYEDGHMQIVDYQLVVPIMEPNDVAGIWPEYVKEIKVPWLMGCYLTLRLRPCILSDNPEIQGMYGKRRVFYVPEPS